MRQNAKVHIPGPLIGRVQKCIRCHVRMDSNDRWANTDPVGWPVGVPVVSDRTGMSVEREPAAVDGIRACGRKRVA